MHTSCVMTEKFTFQCLTKIGRVSVLNQAPLFVHSVLLFFISFFSKISFMNKCHCVSCGSEPVPNQWLCCDLTPGGRTEHVNNASFFSFVLFVIKIQMKTCKTVFILNKPNSSLWQGHNTSAEQDVLACLSLLLSAWSNEKKELANDSSHAVSCRTHDESKPGH